MNITTIRRPREPPTLEGVANSKPIPAAPWVAVAVLVEEDKAAVVVVAAAAAAERSRIRSFKDHTIQRYSNLAYFSIDFWIKNGLISVPQAQEKGKEEGAPSEGIS